MLPQLLELPSSLLPADQALILLLREMEAACRRSRAPGCPVTFVSCNALRIKKRRRVCRTVGACSRQARRTSARPSCQSCRGHNIAEQLITGGEVATRSNRNARRQLRLGCRGLQFARVSLLISSIPSNSAQRYPSQRKRDVSRSSGKVPLQCDRLVV